MVTEKSFTLLFHLGVPEITPVVAFRLRPVGSEPAIISKRATRPEKVGAPLEKAESLNTV